jgi:peptidoglycan biosynthesis protein MviN/MurJ (putative lipid II flippase)
VSVIRSSLWFTFGTLLSRLSGLIRDVVLAGVFGASSAMESCFF